MSDEGSVCGPAAAPGRADSLWLGPQDEISCYLLSSPRSCGKGSVFPVKLEGSLLPVRSFLIDAQLGGLSPICRLLRLV